MCDIECLKRIQNIEIQVMQMSTDMAWIKKIVGSVFILIAAALGMDITGIV